MMNEVWRAEFRAYALEFAQAQGVDMSQMTEFYWRDVAERAWNLVGDYASIFGDSEAKRLCKLAFMHYAIVSELRGGDNIQNPLFVRFGIQSIEQPLPLLSFSVNGTTGGTYAAAQLHGSDWLTTGLCRTDFGRELLTYLQGLRSLVVRG